MGFANKLKKLRKKIGYSQERLADKIGVSRQAVTKWETGNGNPDIENIMALSSLFNISIDELLMNKNDKKEELEYMFDSVTEYDINALKCFDIKLGDAKHVFVNGYDGEKLLLKLSSNTIISIKENLKVKIDDIKSRIDIELNKKSELTKAELKKDLYIDVCLPNKYIEKSEISVNSNYIELNSLECENIELDIKSKNVFLNNVTGSIEINCNNDLKIVANDLKGELSINQISSTSTLLLPKELSFFAIKKGIGTKIYYEENGKRVSEFSKENSDNVIELNGIKSELIISCATNEDE